MSRLKKVVLALGPVFIVGASLAAFSFQHFWMRSLTSAVFLDEVYSDQATVFWNCKGDFLISTNEQTRSESYVYLSSRKQIGVPNDGQFIFLGLLAYNKDLPLPVVASSDRTKIEQDMDIVEENEWVEFTGLSRRRIKIYRSRP